MERNKRDEGKTKERDEGNLATSSGAVRNALNTQPRKVHYAERRAQKCVQRVLHADKIVTLHFGREGREESVYRRRVIKRVQRKSMPVFSTYAGFAYRTSVLMWRLQEGNAIPY